MKSWCCNFEREKERRGIHYWIPKSSW